MDEFDLIRRFFDRRLDAAGVAVGIGDDGAVLNPDAANQQVQVIDTLVEGVHFPEDTNPADIAYRAVAVNLSDIAAMGARPRWMTLALTMHDASEHWVEAFASGLFDAADTFGVALVGGDTTRGATLVVTVSITGEVERGTSLLRRGARPGDAIFVTGTLGDAAAGLSLLQRGEPDSELVQRFLRPTPRIDIGTALVAKASAAIDISDGLVGDLSKLLTASGVGGEIHLDKLPLSDALRQCAPAAQQIQWATCGGDDYELCFTANEDVVTDIDGITKIGRITAGRDLKCKLDGDVVEIDVSGYRHFQ